MHIKTLQQLFERDLQDLYSAESQVIDALPKMIKAASDEKLKTALQDHLEVTHEQLARLEDIKEEVFFETDGQMCAGMKGIIAEGEKALSEVGDSDTKNAAIIAAAQKVEHYEMAGYGTAEAYARLLGYEDVADLLKDSLEEEKKADRDLNGLAEGGMFSKGLNEEASS
jgi:ferritin-like metal-binding protein YciE